MLKKALRVSSAFVICWILTAVVLGYLLNAASIARALPNLIERGEAPSASGVILAALVLPLVNISLLPAVLPACFVVTLAIVIWMMRTMHDEKLPWVIAGITVVELMSWSSYALYHLLMMAVDNGMIALEETPQLLLIAGALFIEIPANAVYLVSSLSGAWDVAGAVLVLAVIGALYGLLFRFARRLFRAPEPA